MKWGKLVWVLLALLLAVIITACSDKKPEETAEPENEEPTESKEPTEPKEPEVVHKEITISAIGDMLIHSSVYKDAQTADGYDFMPMLERVKPFLNDTTLTFANQETMIGGKQLGLSTYPRFNSPYAVGNALKKSGVDVVSLANNHTLDGGEEAIQSAIEHWESIDMMYTGAYKSEADSDKIRVYETNEGISVAFLAYTYGTNGLPVPEGKDYLVNLIDKELMASRIQEAKKQADAVVLSMHFGNQYERLPSDGQKELVQFAADSGVDVVLGHHPHVLQPIDWIEGSNGNKTLVAYSLGNFLSGQDEFYRRIGGIFKFTIHKTIEGEKETVEVKSPQLMPTFVKYSNWANYQVAPMYQLTNDELANAEKHYQEIKDHMSQWVPKLEFIEE
ncbi:CapA family protein [Virgibacillus litoralis]|uniref:Poly-gamma-glutamate synthesis protein (Capsule biosynthesis protein) n=1 Tax=Virgibacillus litoralis TaxID=578221 RepID=A0ABS4HC58_9BACI|nr:CapA family protein [Virgibacillus litoralis]MBP1948448.1 poly-gamma-glutamate synthesis protein (capsule biosynthesis protein) [Virgibacillus litoralis]